MNLDIKLGCSVCNYSDDRSVEMPFNTDAVICPKCSESDSMYIVCVNESSKIKDLKNINKTMINKLHRIRQL